MITMVRKCPECKSKESVYEQTNGRQRCAACDVEVKPPHRKQKRASLPRARFQPLNGKVNRKCGAKPGDPRGAEREKLCNDGTECTIDASFHDIEDNLLVCGVHRRVRENAT